MVNRRQQPKRPTRKPVKRTKPSKTKRNSAQQVKKGVWNSLLFLYRIGLIFILLIMFGFFFWLYMAKERQFIAYSDEISSLRVEVQELRSLTSRRKAQIEREHHRIERLARKELGLINALEAPVHLIIDREKLIYYGEKDSKMD